MDHGHDARIPWEKVRSYELLTVPFILIAMGPVLADHFSSELYSFLVFIGIFSIYAIRKYDARLLIGAAILLLTVSAVELAWGSKAYANTLSLWAYYFLVAGVLASFVEYIRSPEEFSESKEAPKAKEKLP